MFDDIVTLIHEIDEEHTEETEVFASVESVGQKEFFAAAQTGMKSELKLSVRSSDYDGEPIASVGGRNYEIYRTYLRRDGKTELFLGEKVGI